MKKERVSLSRTTWNLGNLSFLLKKLTSFEVQKMSRIISELWYQLWDTKHKKKKNAHYSRFFCNLCLAFIAWSFLWIDFNALFSWWQAPCIKLRTASTSHTTNIWLFWCYPYIWWRHWGLGPASYTLQMIQWVMRDEMEKSQGFYSWRAASWER